MSASSQSSSSSPASSHTSGGGPLVASLLVSHDKMDESPPTSTSSKGQPSPPTDEWTRVENKKSRRGSSLQREEHKIPRLAHPAASLDAPIHEEQHIDLATYPSADLLKVLAALLTQIAHANDALRLLDATNAQHQRHKHQDADDHSSDEDEPSTKHHFYSCAKESLMSPSSTLCFHARNVPGISIENYLVRILKYCPTTNEVFISLLVYFDRMANLDLGTYDIPEPESTSQSSPQPDRPPTPYGVSSTPDSPKKRRKPKKRLFAIDSYNIHRLVIAGITVASKFFSDVFYTNSRYAKVGGLPLQELNLLELQFLLLNDFSLAISKEELQRYADKLCLSWKAESSLPLPSPNSASVHSPFASQPSSPARPPTKRPSPQIAPSSAPIQPKSPAPAPALPTADPSTPSKSESALPKFPLRPQQRLRVTPGSTPRPVSSRAHSHSASESSSASTITPGGSESTASPPLEPRGEDEDDEGESTDEETRGRSRQREWNNDGDVLMSDC